MFDIIMAVPATKCVLFLFLIFIVTGVSSQPWHYGEEEKWPPMCREGKSQSPIALNERKARDKDFPAFQFHMYNENYPVRLKNNGHSAEMRLHVQDQPKISGGGLNGTFVLDHLHFHWKSEHTINKHRFPLELHMVHYSTLFNNLSEALKVKNNVAVFAVLFYLSPDDSKDFKPLIDVIDLLFNNTHLVEQATFNIEDFLPRDQSGFYRYEGSLTTPDCTEGLIWTVFSNYLPISKRQAESFSKMQTEEHIDLPHNYRPLQELHGRTVYIRRSPMQDLGDNSADAPPSAFGKILCVVSLLLYKLLA